VTGLVFQEVRLLVLARVDVVFRRHKLTLIFMITVNIRRGATSRLPAEAEGDLN